MPWEHLTQVIFACLWVRTVLSHCQQYNIKQKSSLWFRRGSYWLHHSQQKRCTFVSIVGHWQFTCWLLSAKKFTCLMQTVDRPQFYSYVELTACLDRPQFYSYVELTGCLDRPVLQLCGVNRMSYQRLVCSHFHRRASLFQFCIHASGFVTVYISRSAANSNFVIIFV